MRSPSCFLANQTTSVLTYFFELEDLALHICHSQKRSLNSTVLDVFHVEEVIATHLADDEGMWKVF